MTRRLMQGLLFTCCLSFAAQAQAVSDAFVESLNKQGFVIHSVGYTWLWRTVVLATDGTHEREIVIARGSGQILQDNWRVISATEQNPKDSDDVGNSPTGPASGKGKGPGGRSGGPSGPGGPGD